MHDRGGSARKVVAKGASASTLARADPLQLRVTSETDLGGDGVSALAAERDGIWLALQNAPKTTTIVRVDAVTQETATAVVEGSIIQLAATATAVWALGESPDGSRVVAWRVDRRTARVVTAIDLHAQQHWATTIVASDDAAWVGTEGNPGLLQQLDPAANVAVAIQQNDAMHFGALAATRGALWTWDGIRLHRIDAATHRITSRELDRDVFALHPGDDNLWVLGSTSLIEVDTRTMSTRRETPLPIGYSTVDTEIVGEGALWRFSSSGAGVEMRRILPGSFKAATVDLTRFEPRPHLFAVADDSLWIVHQPPAGHAKLLRLRPSI
jgi:hypothetical protein